jgi:hypothetical protein
MTNTVSGTTFGATVSMISNQFFLLLLGDNCKYGRVASLLVQQYQHLQFNLSAAAWQWQQI